MSSFRRLTKIVKSTVNESSDPAMLPADELSGKVPSKFNSQRELGVKPWFHNGLNILSSGLRELDELLGGGVSLGCLIMIESDSYSNYADTILNYSIAQSIALNHMTFIVCDNKSQQSRVLSNLPYNAQIGSLDPKSNPSNDDKESIDNNDKSNQNQKFEIENNEVNKNELKIAWQYGKYIQKDQKKSSMDNKEVQFCYSYDLSRKFQSVLIDIATKNSQLQFYYFDDKDINNSNSNDNSNNISTDLQNLYDSIHAFINQSNQLDPNNIMPFSCSLVNKLTQFSDIVLTIESFAGRNHTIPYEFKEFCGFLSIFKNQQYGIMTPIRTPGTRFGLKRDRRKLHIEPLHLPPEESRSFESQIKPEMSIGSLMPVTMNNSFNHINNIKSMKQEINNDERPRNTPIAASIASLRAARLQQQQQSTSTPPLEPGISCLPTKNNNSKQSLDF
eukprot:gene12056-16133_t